MPRIGNMHLFIRYARGIKWSLLKSTRTTTILCPELEICTSLYDMPEGSNGRYSSPLVLPPAYRQTDPLPRIDTTYLVYAMFPNSSMEKQRSKNPPQMNGIFALSFLSLYEVYLSQNDTLTLPLLSNFYQQ